MLQLKLSVFLCLSLVLFGCTSENQEVKDPLAQQLTTQLEQSCQAGIAFTKTAGEIDKEAEWEEKNINWTESSEESCPLNEELQMILKESYLTSKVTSNYLITQSGDTTVADLKEGLRKSSSLQQQKVIYQGEDQVKYIFTLMKQDSWLYSTDIQMEVFFDDTGFYKEHRLSVRTDIAGISQGFYAGIKGLMRYE